MKLMDIFEEQLRLQYELYPKFMQEHTREERLQDNLKHIIHEVVEVERETNFKHWKQPVKTNWGNVKDELVDVFIFLINACNESDLGAMELLVQAEKKQAINRQRQKDGY